MILNTAPQDQAVLSNVGEIGEFRIRNSAKAFNILSSGLYANKVKAIVRELSCNAVDSHAAAGKHDTPFDVHLPNQLEPWFAIRDYGTGLSHEQVTQIYTTYFESTKTASNEFIGALGLGSKSPFSYTDNFTVTAIQNGVKGVYTAFINDAGVPSIAMMGSEATSEPAGVEVKFAVTDRYDFDKFRTEARNVYRFFKLQPVVSGYNDFKIDAPEYDKTNIVPNVHQYKSTHGKTIAIMGNIAYPVQLPESSVKELGPLANLLRCGLEMHFGIGELDFQASREGLSYIPQTIDSIKAKLEELNGALTGLLKTEADAIDNLWERAIFLGKRKENTLWTAAVQKYATDTALPTYDINRYGGVQTFKVGIEELAKDCNIAIKAFHRYRGNKSCSNSKSSTQYSDQKNANGHYDTWSYWSVHVDTSHHFVINDLKTGAGERARYHYRESQMDVPSRTVFVLEPVDRTKPMKTDEFFKQIHNPPENMRVQASALLEKPRASSGIGRNVSILALQERNHGGYYRAKEMVWRDAGKLDTFDAKTKFFYLPLSGFAVQSKSSFTFTASELNTWIKESGITGFGNITIYGVRKTDIEAIKLQKNWVNIEDHVTQVMSKISEKEVMGLVMSALDKHHFTNYNSNIVEQVDPKSPFSVYNTKFKGHEKVRHSEHALRMLTTRYAKGTTFDVNAVITKFEAETKAIYARYPLLKDIYCAQSADIAEYINLIDAKKGI
jgi:hypothetical protein